MQAATAGVLAPEVVADPYSWFATLRESDPVYWSEPDGAWIITRHSDVLAAFRDIRFSSERVGPAEQRLTAAQLAALKVTTQILQAWMAFRDPPEHTRLRTPVSRTFTPRRVDDLRAAIEGAVDDLLDKLPARHFDLVEHFASPLPAIVIAELLGVPHSYRHEFKSWSGKLSTLVLGVESEHLLDRASEAGRQFDEFFRALISEYRSEPADNIISNLVNGDSGLSDGDLVGLCTLLIFAGHETTASLITNSVVALSADGEARNQFQREPSVRRTGVDELLRMVGPSKIMERRMSEDVVLRGNRLRKGDHVYLAIASANRDPRIFSAPEVLNLERSPNPHLTFGYGIHFCLGASLARLEAQVCLPRLFDRLPSLKVSEDLHYTPVVLGRSLRVLPVSVSDGVAS